MSCWSSRSGSTLIVSDVTLTQVSRHGNPSWSQSLKSCDQSFCQESFVLTVLHVNIPWLMCNNATIKRMQSDKVNLKYILAIQVFVDLICPLQAWKYTYVDFVYRLCPSLQVRWHFLHSLDLHHPICSLFRPDESSQDVNPVHILHSH